MPALTLAALFTLGCQSSIDALGTTPAQARHAADHLFAGFAYRFYNVLRDPVFDRARTLMGQYALTPSRLWRDSTLWNASGPDSTRTLIVGAAFRGDHYAFTADRSARTPRALGDERHTLSLRWLGGGDYEWFTTVDHAVGALTPAAAGAAIVATLTAFEGRTPETALADAARTVPATARHLAQLFTLDSLRVAPGLGATRATLGVTLRPERVRPRYPYLAAYVARYVVPAVYRLRLTDHAGHAFVDIAGRDGWITAQLRSRDHQLVSLTDPPLPLPDSLHLVVDLSMKTGPFRVGFTNLVGDFTIERSTHQRAWMMRFRREPAWHFPLAVDKLIKKPLRRPFEGRGAELMLGVRDDLGSQTMSVRHARFSVNEGAIMRWLGRLGASAFGEFIGRTELEENLFLYEMFETLRKEEASGIRQQAAGSTHGGASTPLLPDACCLMP